MQEQMIALSKQSTKEDIEKCIKAVKAKYGETAQVYIYEVEDKKCFLRSIDRNTYSAAAAKVSTSPAKFNEIVINQIWLGGDDEIKNNDQYYFGLVEFVEELMGKKKGSLKAL
jgi:hypothetical protein